MHGSQANGSMDDITSHRTLTSVASAGAWTPAGRDCDPVLAHRRLHWRVDAMLPRAAGQE